MFLRGVRHCRHLDRHGHGADGRLGPQVGDPVPTFTLQDRQDRTRALSSLMGPKGAVLV